MITSNQQQQLPGLPVLSFPLHIGCSRCGHSADMTVGFEVIRSLYKLRCSYCGGRGRDLNVGGRSRNI